MKRSFLCHGPAKKAALWFGLAIGLLGLLPAQCVPGTVDAAETGPEVSPFPGRQSPPAAAEDRLSLDSFFIKLLLENKKGNYQAVFSGSRDILEKDPAFYPAFRLLVEASAEKSRAAGSGQALSAALDFVSKSVSERPSSPYCHYALGLCHKNKGDFLEARQSLEKSVAFGARFWDVYEELLICCESKSDLEAEGAFIKEQIRTQPDNPFLYQAKGTIDFMLSEYQESLSAMGKALHLHRRSGDRKAESRCLCYMSYVEMYSNDYPEAMKLAEASLALAQKLGEKTLEAVSLELISFIWIDQGDYSRALDFSLRALSALRERPHSRVENVCQRTLGVVYLEMGNLAGSKECLEKSLEFYVRDHDRRGQDVCLYWLTLLHKERGDFSTALQCGKKGLQISRELGFTTGEAFHLTSIGDLYRSLGDYDQALEYNKQALQVTEKHVSKWSREECLNTIGHVYAERNDYAGALAYFEQALDYINKIGHKREEAQCLHNIGLAHFGLGRYPQALDDFSKSLRSAQKSGKKTIIGSNLNRLGDLYRILGKQSEAKLAHEKARQIGQETGHPTILWESLAGLGTLARLENDLNQTILHFKAAVDVVEDLRNQLLMREESSGFFKSKISLYEELVSALYDQHRLHDSPDCAEECFLYAERAKARAFLDDLRKARVEVDPSSRAAAILGQTCRREDILRNLLDENTALVEYFIGEKNVFIFTITKGGFFVERTGFPQSGRLLDLVHNYTKLLSSKKISGKDCLTAGQRVYRYLLTPVERTLPPNIQKLIIIPDRQLCYLPFEALVIPGNPSKGRRSEPVFLVEKFEVSYAPSASSLLRILDRRMEQDGQMDILAVGDPRGFGSNPGSIPDEDDPFQQYYQKTHFPRFPLLFASQEMELVSRFFSRSSQVLLAQEQATEANLKRLPLTDFRVIHFATHGLLDERTASRSALALALDGAGEEDGYLQAREIYELEMSADLVVLSACQTALGKMENGEGVEGIARAFFCAGTRSVVASLWNINDRSTAVFMKYFYADLTKGRTKREALALAKKRMLRSFYSSPYHWAAFILLGEAGARMP